MLILEACVDSLPQALRAQALGAHRIELCSRLDLDGLSPSPQTILAALSQLKIGVKVMIRPRPGSFIFSKEELRQMEQEILFCRENGVKEVVLGVSLPSGRLDIPAIEQLAKQAWPMSVTVHKAIDESPDPLSDLEGLRSVANITHILSSGRQATALAGAALLRDMIRVAGDRFTILVAGKVTRENLEAVHQIVRAREYHGKRIVGELEMNRVEKAQSGDAGELTLIAHAAKRHWNYPEEWIQAWQEDLTFTSDYILKHPVFKMVGDEERILGCCAYEVHPSHLEIVHMWILPEVMGKGLGRKLLEVSLKEMLSAYAKPRIQVVSDPYAQPFYEKMGFEKVGESPSYPPGRFLPLMEKKIAH